MRGYTYKDDSERRIAKERKNSKARTQQIREYISDRSTRKTKRSKQESPLAHGTQLTHQETATTVCSPASSKENPSWSMGGSHTRVGSGTSFRFSLPIRLSDLLRTLGSSHGTRGMGSPTPFTHIRLSQARLLSHRTFFLSLCLLHNIPP
jgi:hypothetical protein